jgi:S1-C subfamily serine protease
MHVKRSTAIAASLGAVAVLLLASAQVVAEHDAERVFREARGYTVRIRTQITTPFICDRQGSFEGAGFLVDAARGWIVTNAHVVAQSPSEVQVAFAGEPFQTARKVYVDCFADVAVLAVGKVGRGRKAAELNCADEVRIGEPVGAFGHPLGMYFTGTRGIVSGKTDQLGPDLLQIDATVDHGNSGGPTIALRDGRVVGITTALGDGDKADRVNFATPMKDVGRILDLLRHGITPSPPFMQFALLRDETGSHTLEVAGSFDSRRWPLLPGDRILAIQGGEGKLRTLSDLVSALRGRTGPVPLVIERGRQTTTIEVTPVPAPLVTAERGVSVDGALIASIPFEDEVNLGETPCLFVHSVEPGSTAETLGLEPMDILHRVDGRRFGDLDSLCAYLRERPEGRALKVVFRRMSPFTDRWFDYLVREMPGKDVHSVGSGSDLVAEKQD